MCMEKSVFSSINDRIRVILFKTGSELVLKLYSIRILYVFHTCFIRVDTYETRMYYD